MRDARFFLSWPGAHLREIGIAAGIGVALLCANFFWQPSVEPFKPAELAVASPAEPGSSVMVEEESLDFIDRPLFWSSRRPPVAVATDEVAIVTEESEASEAAAEQLEGVQLLGTFGSGDRSGAIIAAKDDERERLYVGDTLGGWTLIEVASRAAFFESPAGARATIDLAVASNLPKPATVAAATPVEATADDGGASSANEAKPETTEPARSSYRGPVTFDSIAQKQRERVEARQKQAAVAAEEADKANQRK